MILATELYRQLMKSFCRGVQGGQFLQKAPPLAAGGNKNANVDYSW